MKEIIIYLLENFLISTLFFVVYLWVKNRSIPSFKRVLLLCWLVSSILFPWITIDGYTYSVPELSYVQFESPSTASQMDIQWESPNPIVNQDSNKITTTPSKTSDNPASVRQASIETYMIIIFFSVALLLLAKLFIGLVQIVSMKRNAKKVYMDDQLVFVVNEPAFTGASFFKWIFMGSQINPGDKDLILQHEITHSRLGHSSDVMLGTLYQVIFWFNPLSWYLLKQIKINTELETDFALSKKVSIKRYGDLLLNLHQARTSFVLNSFSSSHLKIRIQAMTNQTSQKKWVRILPFVLVAISFLTVSCSDLVDNSSYRHSESTLDHRLSDIKSITSKFISHQNDTHQKTGKVVSRVTFHPDGSLNEFVNQTSYPYDRDQALKRTFWDEPIKRNLFHVMDGLSIGEAERNLLYGNDWPTAYLKYLRGKRNGELQFRFWNEQITSDREVKPTSITIEKEYQSEGLSQVTVPITTEFFKYDGNRVIETSSMNEYKIDQEQVASYISEHEEMGDFLKRQMERARRESGKVREGIKFFFEGELLASVTFKDPSGSQVNYKFYYEDDLLTKQEYYKYGRLINSRVFYYKNGLKERTEIFNVYNEPEYTILYEYEFW